MRVPVTELQQGMVLRNGETIESVTRSGAAVVVETRTPSGDHKETLEGPGTEYEVEATDITPTWQALVPIFVGVLQNPKAPVTAHREAEANIRQMAALADRYVALVQRSSGDTVGLTPALGDPDAQEN